MKVLAIIPARGGSKGIKDKNIIDFNGQPLIAWTIQAAQEAGICDEIMVSTESKAIAQVAREFGAQVPFYRSEELAQDTSKTIDCVVEVLSTYRSLGRNFDIVLLLQPTSPLRSGRDIKQAFDMFLENGRRSLASVAHGKHPVLMRTMDEKSQLEPILPQQINQAVRRQDLGKVYVLNGAIYINNVDEINPLTNFNNNEIGFVMSCKKSVDIDDEEDLAIAKLLHSCMS